MKKIVQRRTPCSAVLALLLILAVSSPLFAWTEHPLVSHPVLAAMSECCGAPAVPAESLESFLMREERGIEKILAEEEAWARQHLPWYAPRPTELAFKATGSHDDVRLRFCRAIRVNPRSIFALSLHLVPGAAPCERPRLEPRNITFLEDTSHLRGAHLVRLSPAEAVRPLDVVVTATEEPDLGLDIGLFEDNGTEFGKIYGFGRQSFGNPNLEFGSQAPFHMGFYHESPVVYALAGFLKKTYPEYRIHLYKRLAVYAFATGHPYWGWRFTGWGLHYLADLAQPYHATVMPGAGTLRLLWINTLDVVGVHALKKNAVQLLSNRHIAMEKYGQLVFREAYEAKAGDSPVLAALRTSQTAVSYDDTVPREVIARLAHTKAAETDRAIVGNMPAALVSDPRFEFGTSAEQGRIVERVREEKGEGAEKTLTGLIADALLPFAAYGPAYVRAVLSEVGVPPSAREPETGEREKTP